MKAVGFVLLVVWFALLSAFGQGEFFVNTHDPAGSDLRFVMADGTPASGPDLFVELLAGTNATSLVPLMPLLTLNRTGANAGYTNPYEPIFAIPGVGFAFVEVGFRAFEGSSWDTATVRSDLELSPNLTWAVEPGGTPPNEVFFGTRTIVLLPESSTLALILAGLTVLFVKPWWGSGVRECL